MKRFASAALWAALATQAIWVAANTLAWHRTPAFDVPGAIIHATFTAFAARHHRSGWRWLSLVVRGMLTLAYVARPPLSVDALLRRIGPDPARDFKAASVS